MKKYLLILTAICLFCLEISAQNRTISGRITDEKGKPIPGVSIRHDNTSAGAVTDEKGNFSIAVGTNVKQLSVSAVSFVSQNVSIEDKTTLNVVLKEDVIGLEEVVAVGYASQKKINLTGAVTSVTIDEVEGRAVTNVDQILQGKAAGVSITQNSGRPGADLSEIRIRGISSIDNNNEPLVIIDGIQANLNDVSPNDVASVSILKDAASAAIYGSRASAGVIVIETKKGNAGGGLKVDYSGTYSVSNATRLPETVNSYTYATLMNEARENMGLPRAFTDEQIGLYQEQTDPAYPNTDWYDVYYQSSRMQNHYIGLRGGDKNYQFSNSVSYKDQEGVLQGTSSERVSFNSNLSGSFFDKKLRLTLGATGYRDQVDELISPTNSALAEIAGFIPTYFVRSIDTLTGNDNLYSYASRFLAARNLGGGINNAVNNLNTRFAVELEPIKNLKGRISAANNKYKTNYMNFSPEFYTAGSFLETTVNKRQSMLEKRFSQSDLNTFLASLEYSLTAGKHDFKIFAAHEKLETIYKFDEGSVKDLSSNSPIFNFGDPNTLFLNSAAYEFATASYFGRFNYAFADKYLLELNFRRDGSSRFAEGHKWGNFPSISAAWRISEENFLKEWDFVNLKFRASWGRLGNQNIWTQYAFADQMNGQEYYAFGNSVVPGRGTTVLANRATRWETTEQSNFGVDLVLWNRLDFTADIFRKETSDILARVTIPPSLGVSALPYQNVGSMVNKGVELSLGYKSPYRKGKLNYSVSTNFTYLTNELTSLGDLLFIDHSATNRSVVGQPFSSFYGYKVEGIYQLSDFTWQDDSDASIPHADRNYVLKTGMPNPSNLISDPAPGDVRLADTNGDGNLNPDDKELMGSPLPKIQYGFSINLSYRNFGLNVIGQGVGKVDAYMNGNLIAPFFNTVGPLRTETAANRWTFEQPSERYTRIYVDKTRDALISSYNIYNAAFFRLKSVQLSYTLPTDFTGRYKINRCRVFLNAENPLLLTNFVEGFDPERSYNNVTAAFHPQITSFSLGLNFDF